METLSEFMKRKRLTNVAQASKLWNEERSQEERAALADKVKAHREAADQRRRAQEQKQTEQAARLEQANAERIAAEKERVRVAYVQAGGDEAGFEDHWAARVARRVTLAQERQRRLARRAL